MRRFNMEVLVRPKYSAKDSRLPEQIKSINVTANNELSARRMVLERAWLYDLLVTSFMSVSARQI